MKVLLLCDQDEKFKDHENFMSYPVSHLQILKKIFGDDADVLQHHNFTKWKGSALYNSQLQQKLKEYDVNQYDFILGTGDSYFSRLFKPDYTEKQFLSNLFPKNNKIEFGLPNDRKRADYFFSHQNIADSRYYNVGFSVPTEYLYVEEQIKEKLNVFVDHFQPRSNDITSYLLKYMEDVQKKYPMIDVYHHNNFDITKNMFKRQKYNFEEQGSYVRVEMKELHSIYRTMDVGMSTHRESAGSFLPELALCGAACISKKGFYKPHLLNKIDHFEYNDFKDINWNDILHNNTLEKKKKRRQKAIEYYSVEAFRNRIYSALEKIK